MAKGNHQPSAGHKADKLWRDALLLAVKREAEKGQKTRKLALLADALVDKALAGDVQALREIGDRLDGKATQPISGDADNPVTFIVSTGISRD